MYFRSNILSRTFAAKCAKLRQKSTSLFRTRMSAASFDAKCRGTSPTSQLTGCTACYSQNRTPSVATWARSLPHRCSCASSAAYFLLTCRQKSHRNYCARRSGKVCKTRREALKKSPARMVRTISIIFTECVKKKEGNRADGSEKLTGKCGAIFVMAGFAVLKKV